MAEPKRIDIKEFRSAGYLQEANRLFFHPLGLALEVVVEADGAERLGGVWDYRDDPEGMLYGDDLIGTPEALANARRISTERSRKMVVRDPKGCLLGVQTLPKDRRA